MKYLLFLFLVFSCSYASPSRAEPVVVFYGDSLISGYGLKNKKDFLPNVLMDKLNNTGLNIKIRNAGVAGNTTSDGVVRLNWTLQEQTDYFILALGANDMLRFTPVATIVKNLDTILAQLKEKKIPTLLVGVKAPPNYGKEYVNSLEKAYLNLAKKYAIPLYPFLLDGIASVAKLNQADGIHPNPRGVKIIVNNFYVVVAKWLKSFVSK